MLSRKYRIHRRKDILFVLRRGKAIPVGIGTVRIKENSFGHPRASVIVSNAVSKKATVRNTIKRRVREALRKELLPHLQSFDVIIIAKPQSVNASYKYIVAELKNFLFKAPYLSRPPHQGGGGRANSSLSSASLTRP